MALFNKKKKYYFSDDSIASDTVIAFILGGVSFIIELTGIFESVKTGGNVPDIIGLLYVCAFLLSVCGVAFAWFGFNAEEGGVKSKRFSLFLNIFTIVVPLFMLGLYWFVC